jgi:class 3 adenylate cyclase/tetratricopeptide (TPR) repeat protein
MPTNESQLAKSAAAADEIAPGSLGRRFQLVVVFNDLSKSTNLGRAIEPELYSEMLEAVREIWVEVVTLYGGRVARIQGDGALIVFGLPHPQEDDGRRAVEAALDIHERVRALPTSGLPTGFGPLLMHSGVHAGMLLLNEGDLERGRFDLIGDIVNTAAHLGQLARAGEIIVSLNALGPNANFFRTSDVTARASSDLGRFGAGNVRLVSVEGRGNALTRFDSTFQRGLTPLVGRSTALQKLKEFVSDERPNAPNCVVVSGPAGIGKTRLLEELCRSAEAGQRLILKGACENYLGAELLQPFMQIVQSQGDRCTASFRDLLTRLTAIRQTRAVVMLLDDWQWADDASRTLLDALLQPSDDLLRVVITSRPQEDGQLRFAGAEQIVIAPFAHAETLEAVQTLLPHADPFLAAQVHDYAGGVPLFIEELCHHASADSVWRALQGRDTADTWLGTLVASRLMRLPDPLRVLVCAAAVIGNRVPRKLLSKLANAEPSAECFAALSEADFLYAEGNGGDLRFKHGITCDAVYASIGLKERKALHMRVLDLSKAEMGVVGFDAQIDRERIEKPSDMHEALAHHSRGAGVWEEATFFSEWAGDKASAAFALDRARAHYQAAIDALDRMPQIGQNQSLRWCSLANKLGFTCIFDPLALGDDLSIFERAVTLANDLGDATILANALYWLGYMYYGTGRFKGGAGYLRKALTLAETAVGDPRFAAQVRATLGQTLAAACEYDEALLLIDAAVSAKRSHGQSPVPTGKGRSVAIGSAYSLACKGGVLADRGQFDEAHGCFAEALLLLDGSLHPVANSVRNWIAIAHLWQGHWDEAERVATESVRIAENAGALLLLAMNRALAGWAAWGGRNDGTGLDQMRDAVRWMESRQGRFYVSLHYGWLVEASFEQNKIEEARIHAAKALARTRSGELIGESTTSRALALAAAQNGNARRSAQWLARANHSATLRMSSREHALNDLTASRIAAIQGNQAQSAEALDRALAAFKKLRMDWHLNHANPRRTESGPALPNSYLGTIFAGNTAHISAAKIPKP